MQLFAVFIVSCIATLACAAACKIDAERQPQLDENGQPVKKEKKSDFVLLAVFETFTPLGLGILVSNLADYFVAWNEIYVGREFNMDFVMSTIIFGIGEVIGFIIFFYIIYGIMSLFKAYGNDEKSRRNTAGWVTVVLGFISIFILAGQ